MFQKKMFKTLHQNKFLHNGKPSFQFLTLIQNSQKELKTASLISSPMNFCRVQTTMLGKKYSNPNSQDFLNSLFQHQVVPVKQRTLPVNQYQFPPQPQPTIIWFPQSQSQIMNGLPLVNLVIVQHQLPQHLGQSPHTLQKNLLGPYSPKSLLSIHQEKEGLLMLRNLLSSTYPILNPIQFISRIHWLWPRKFCPQNGFPPKAPIEKYQVL